MHLTVSKFLLVFLRVFYFFEVYSQIHWEMLGDHNAQLTTVLMLVFHQLIIGNWSQVLLI